MIDSSPPVAGRVARASGVILLVTIGYPPDQVGGTEVYVQGLGETLLARGWQVAVACLEEFSDPDAPGIRRRDTALNGLPVYRIGLNQARLNTSGLAFDDQLRLSIADEFLRVLDELKPALVHVHPLRLGVFNDIISAAHQRGIPSVFTFHSSTTTCPRGDMLYMGREDCDGRLDQTRCSACLMQNRGLPEGLARTLAHMPMGVWQATFAVCKPVRPLRKVASLASLPMSIGWLRRNWDTCTGLSARVVAVCEWVKRASELNGVPTEKILLSRHGLRIPSRVVRRPAGAPPVFGYLGRCSPEKGIECLVNALAQVPPEVKFTMEICSATLTKDYHHAAEAQCVKRVRDLATRDPRVRLLPGVSDERLADTLAGWDALLVPSLWFESGPQVVYEAFAVQTPVIGSRRGGIAELVQHGVTGFLHAPGDSEALARLLTENARDAAPLRALRANIPPQRTVASVTQDMEALYCELLGATKAGVTASVR